jgi:hypothetical protein
MTYDSAHTFSVLDVLDFATRVILLFKTYILLSTNQEDKANGSR